MPGVYKYGMNLIAFWADWFLLATQSFLLAMQIFMCPAFMSMGDAFYNYNWVK